MLLNFLNFMLRILRDAFSIDIFICALGFVVFIIVLSFIHKMSRIK